MRLTKDVWAQDNSLVQPFYATLTSACHRCRPLLGLLHFMRSVGQQRRLEQRQPQGGGKENLVGWVEVPAPAAQCACHSGQATGSKIREAGTLSYGSSANFCGRRMGVRRIAN